VIALEVTIRPPRFTAAEADDSFGEKLIAVFD